MKQFLSLLNEEVEKAGEVNFDRGKLEKSQDEVIDFMRPVLLGVSETRHEIMHRQFAKLTAKAFQSMDWDRAEQFARVLRGCRPVHIAVLFAAQKFAKSKDDAFGGLPVIYLPPSAGEERSDSSNWVPDIHELLGGEVSLAALRIAVAELISMGLLTDAAFGVIGYFPSMSILALTDAGRDFLAWLGEYQGD